MKLTGSKILLESLIQEGVETIFGYPGGTVINIYDDLMSSSIKHILTRHEQAAVHAADGYARATGKVGVAIATSGPRSDEHDHRDRYGIYGFDSDGCHYRPGTDRPDRQ